MSLERLKREHRALRYKVEEAVNEASKQFKFCKKNEYHIFFNGQNTGEVVKLPELDQKELKRFCKEIKVNTGKDISLTHRNMYIKNVGV